MLIKDNHLALAGSIQAAVEAVRARAGHMVKVEVEVDTLDQLREALARTDRRRAARQHDARRNSRKPYASSGGRVLTEASGGIESAKRRARSPRRGVDLISVGWLTHSAPALDFGLDIAL